MILKKEISVGDLVQLAGVVAAAATIFWRVQALEKNDLRQDAVIAEQWKAMKAVSENVVRLDAIYEERNRRNTGH